eukprot:SAG22_NODE_21553_length_256_cov_0.656051_1_plen_61_part_10
MSCADGPQGDAAAAAGVLVGAKVVAVDGAAVATRAELVGRIGAARLGALVEFDLEISMPAV